MPLQMPDAANRLGVPLSDWEYPMGNSRMLFLCLILVNLLGERLRRHLPGQNER